MQPNRKKSAPSAGIHNGVEWFHTDYGLDAQCARCGSSVSEASSDDATLVCLASADWCEHHPIKGREEQKGAGR